MIKLDKERMRMRVIHLHAQGLSNRGIARAIHKSPTYVDTWVKRYQLHGHVRDMPHTGRPRSLTPALVHTIHKRMRGQRYQSIRTVAAQLRAGGIRISNTSVWNAATGSGLKPYVRKKKPLLSKQHKQRRLSFARKYRHHDWRRHMFADEKTFYLFSLANRKNDVIWASRGDNIEPASVVKNTP